MTTLTYPTITLHPSVQHLSSQKARKTRRNVPITRKERRRLQRREIEQLLARTDFKIYVLSTQLRSIRGQGDSLNVLICTNHKQIVFHLSIEKARALANKYPTGKIELTPVLAKGAGQGQVGTQFRGCFLRLRPMKSSRVELVEYVERKLLEKATTPKENQKKNQKNFVPTQQQSQILPSIHDLGLSNDDANPLKQIKQECGPTPMEIDERIEGAKILLMLLQNAKHGERNMSKKRKLREWQFHDVSKNPKKKCRVDPRLAHLRHHMPKLLRVATSKPKVPQRRISIVCTGFDAPVSFWVGPSCTAKEILGHVSKFSVFNLKSYDGLYLQDASGALFHDNASLYACNTLYLRQVKQA